MKEHKHAPVLDARLAAAASYVRCGGVCADIGCDHGKLSAYLVASNICRRVIACDMREAPLERARQTLMRWGVQHLAELRLADGLAGLQPNEADDIVIAGMSGVTISDILQRGREIWQGARFILVPVTKHSVLRAFLAQNGFELQDETPCIAAGKIYTVMLAEYTGDCCEADWLMCAVGKVACKKTPEAKAYLTRVAQLCKKYARGVSSQMQAQVLELAKCIEQEAD